MRADAAPLDAGRWHFQHGPIDCIVAADGEAAAVAGASSTPGALRQRARRTGGRAAAAARRSSVADATPRWPGRAPHGGGVPRRTPRGASSRRWRRWPAAVAEELIASYDRPRIERAWINNGGDIALHLAPGHRRGRPCAPTWRASPRAAGRSTASSAPRGMPVRGVATSGWRGRSFSLGIADSVTVLAATPSEADAAATVDRQCGRRRRCAHPARRRAQSRTTAISAIAWSRATCRRCPSGWSTTALARGAGEARAQIAPGASSPRCSRCRAAGASSATRGRRSAGGVGASCRAPAAARRRRPA